MTSKYQFTWAKVRQVLHGRDHNHDLDVTGIDANKLNDHYSAISKDHCYEAPYAKLSLQDRCCLISEMDVFYMLDPLKPTATGLDAIPALFLQMGAPAFAAPLATLLNQSISASVVPQLEFERSAKKRIGLSTRFYVLHFGRLRARFDLLPGGPASPAYFSITPLVRSPENAV